MSNELECSFGHSAYSFTASPASPSSASSQVKPDDCMWTLIDNKIAGTWMDLRFIVRFGVFLLLFNVTSHKMSQVRYKSLSLWPILWPHFDCSDRTVAHHCQLPIDLETKVQITLEKFDNMKWEDPVRHRQSAQIRLEFVLKIALLNTKIELSVCWFGLSLALHLALDISPETPAFLDASLRIPLHRILFSTPKNLQDLGELSKHPWFVRSCALGPQWSLLISCMSRSSKSWTHCRWWNCVMEGDPGIDTKTLGGCRWLMVVGGQNVVRHMLWGLLHSELGGWGFTSFQSSELHTSMLSADTLQCTNIKLS